MILLSRQMLSLAIGPQSIYRNLAGRLFGLQALPTRLLTLIVNHGVCLDVVEELIVYEL